MTLSAPLPRLPTMNRRLIIGAAVVLLHIGVLWMLQSGLTQRPAEVVVRIEPLDAVVRPPAPEPPPQPVVKPPRSTVRQRVPQARPSPRPAPPQPAVTPDPVPAPASVSAPEPPHPSPPPAPVARHAPAPPPPAPVELPSSMAAYLNNPVPDYPALSRRLGEQGKVVVRVLIGVDGRAQQAEIESSSGHVRLDQAALATVRSWRYVPGKRGGVPEAMWFSVPISYVLE